MSRSPAPWSGYGRQPVVFDARGRLVADCDLVNPDTSWAMCQANARAIRALPDLLTAAEAVENAFTDTPLPEAAQEAIDRLYLARRKAEAGEP